MRPWPWIMLMGLPAVLLASPPIYKSVDEKGRVTYSAHPPPDAVRVEQLQTKSSSPSDPGNARERTEAMLDMANELERGRLEKEKLRAEEGRERRRFAQQQAQLEQQQKLLEEMEQYNRGWVRGRYWPYPPVATPLPSGPSVPYVPAGGRGISVNPYGR